jgi:hypothetical protein
VRVDAMPAAPRRTASPVAHVAALIGPTDAHVSTSCAALMLAAGSWVPAAHGALGADPSADRGDEKAPPKLLGKLLGSSPRTLEKPPPKRRF